MAISISIIIYEVANSCKFVRPHLYKFICFFDKSYVFYELHNSYEFVRMTYT